MTVQELIVELQKLPPNAKVWLELSTNINDMDEQPEDMSICEPLKRIITAFDGSSITLI